MLTQHPHGKCHEPADAPGTRSAYLSLVASIHNETRKFYSPGTFSSRVQTFTIKDAVRFSRGYKLDQWWFAYGFFFIPYLAEVQFSTSMNFRTVAVCCRRQIGWICLPY